MMSNRTSAHMLVSLLALLGLSIVSASIAVILAASLLLLGLGTRGMMFPMSLRLMYAVASVLGHVFHFWDREACNARSKR